MFWQSLNLKWWPGSCCRKTGSIVLIDSFSATTLVTQILFHQLGWISRKLNLPCPKTLCNINLLVVMMYFTFEIVLNDLTNHCNIHEMLLGFNVASDPQEAMLTRGSYANQPLASDLETCRHIDFIRHFIWAAQPARGLFHFKFSPIVGVNHSKMPLLRVHLHIYCNPFKFK